MKNLKIVMSSLEQEKHLNILLVPSLFILFFSHSRNKESAVGMLVIFPQLVF